MSRTRNYATVVYPESAPTDWIQILSMHHINCFISPLHDKDVNPTGEPKKPHFHVMIMFDSVKTEEQAKVIFDTIGGVGCEVVKSTRGYARYLCHLDNPDKAQYDINDVLAYGEDYVDIIGLPIDKYTAIADMLDFIDNNAMYNFGDILAYSRDNRSDWFRILCDSATYVIKEYCKSRSWAIKEKNKNA